MARAMNSPIAAPIKIFKLAVSRKVVPGGRAPNLKTHFP
jgi:hypothetical protein